MRRPFCSKRLVALHWSPVPACLRYIDSDGEKRSVFLLPDGCAIGRRAQKHLICLSDPQVSTGHAWIEQRDDGYWVSDMGSGNGTMVNDRRVMSSPLRNGDILRCGDTALRFECTPPSTTAPLAGLLFFSPSGQRTTAPLRADGALLGSFQGSTVYGIHESIARQHAFVYCDGEQWLVLPTSPRHETQVNGHSVGMSGTRLRAGDVIRCGALQVRFVLLKSPIAKLSIDQRQAQLHQCPTDTPQLSVNTASGLTGGGSSMLAAPSGLSGSSGLSGPSGLSTSVRARISYLDRNQVPIVVEVPASGGFLGRASECLVKSDDPQVPVKWGRIFSRDGRWYFEDLGSSSQSFINDQPLFPHVSKELRHRDTIRNRSMVLLFSIDGLLTQSVPLPFGTHSGLTAPLPPPPPSSGAHFLLLSDDGETKLLPIPQQGAVLGRSRGCLITTEDLTTSRQHAKVSIEEDLLLIEDLSKDQGTWVGGVRLLGEKKTPTSGDLVQAGQIKARFLAKNADFSLLSDEYRPFRVLCPIGQLGPLRLYWAEHQELAATVVLKVLPKHVPQHERWLTLLIAESRLLRAHPYSNPSGGTLLRELPSGEYLLSSPLGCGLFLSEFLVVYGAPPLQLALELVAQICADLDRRAQRDGTRKEGQLPLREVWLHSDPLAPLGMATRLLSPSSSEPQRPSPILQAPETGTSRSDSSRNGQVYVYGLLLYSLLTGSLPSYGVPSRKLAEQAPHLPALVRDLLFELLLDEPDRRPDPNHAQRWLADLRSVLVTTQEA